MAETKPKTILPEVVAQLLDITPQELKKLTTAGIIPSATSRKRGTEYELPRVVRAYVKYLRAQTDKPMRSTDFIAELFNITPRRVQQFAKEGIFKSEKDATGWSIDLYDAVKNYLLYVNDGGKTAEEKTKSMTLEEKKINAEIDYKTAKANRAKLELKELQGKMHRSEDVEEMTVQLLSFIRSQLLAFAGTLAVDLENVEGIARRSGVIKKSVNRVLIDMMDFEYSPERYKDLVKAREGWAAKEGDDDED